VNFGGVGQCGTRSEMSEYFCSELGGVGFFRGHTTLQRFVWEQCRPRSEVVKREKKAV
jgi:hypothetical protein